MIWVRLVFARRTRANTPQELLVVGWAVVVPAIDYWAIVDVDANAVVGDGMEEIAAGRDFDRGGRKEGVVVGGDAFARRAAAPVSADLPHLLGLHRLAPP